MSFPNPKASGGGSGGSSAPTNAPYILDTDTAVAALPNAVLGRALTTTLFFAIDDAASAAVTDVFAVRHTTTGLASAAMGTGFLFQLEDDAGNVDNAARMAATWTSASSGNESSFIRFSTVMGGTLAGKIDITASGHVVPVTANVPFLGSMALPFRGLFLRDDGAIVWSMAPNTATITASSLTGIAVTFNASCAVEIGDAQVVLRGSFGSGTGTALPVRITNATNLGFAGDCWIGVDPKLPLRVGLCSGDATTPTLARKAYGMDFPVDEVNPFVANTLVIPGSNTTMAAQSITASTAGVTNWLGVAVTNVASGTGVMTGTGGPVAISGLVYVLAEAGIVQGTKLYSSGTIAGGVASAGVLTLGQQVGIAMEGTSSSISGQILMFIARA